VRAMSEEALQKVLEIIEERIRMWETATPQHLTNLLQKVKMNVSDIQNFCRKIVVDELKFIRRNVKKLKEKYKEISQ
jgi:hypothetical protein